MKGEIDKNFYCSGLLYNIPMSLGPNCVSEVFTSGEATCKTCPCLHRKWPTPEQFKKEYGEEYSENGAFYYLNGDEWWRTMVRGYYESKQKVKVCACTPWGKPPDDWRPE